MNSAWGLGRVSLQIIWIVFFSRAFSLRSSAIINLHNIVSLVALINVFPNWQTHANCLSGTLCADFLWFFFLRYVLCVSNSPRPPSLLLILNICFLFVSFFLRTYPLLQKLISLASSFFFICESFTLNARGKKGVILLPMVSVYVIFFKKNMTSSFSSFIYS